MAKRDYGSVRALVAVDDSRLRDGLLDAFARAGLPPAAMAATPAALRDALAAGVDLAVISHDLAGEFVAPLIAEVRRGRLGPQPFPIVVALVAGGDPGLARRVSDCGPDDILALPVTPAAVLRQVGVYVGGARKPLVVTPGYAGPERRSGPRPAAPAAG